ELLHNRRGAADRARPSRRKSRVSGRQEAQALPLPYPLLVAPPPHRPPPAARSSTRQRRVAIIVSRFHEAITSKLLDGARDALRRGGIADTKVEVMWVPGAFGLPAVAEAPGARGGGDAWGALRG